MTATLSRPLARPLARRLTRPLARPLALAFAGLALLGACESQVAVPTYADITFTHMAPITLDVAEIKVVRAYAPTGQAPNVELEFPVSPLETAARWARDRLRAGGDEGTATVRIMDASVVERPLEKETGVTGLFTTDQAEKYDARYLVELSAENPNRGLASQTQAEVTRTQTVPEGLTYNAREKIWYQLSEKMARDLDSQMSANVREHMAGFVIQ
jgi:hypothetical protein